MPRTYRFRKRRPPGPNYGKDYSLPYGGPWDGTWEDNRDLIIDYYVGQKVEVYVPLDVRTGLQPAKGLAAIPNYRGSFRVPRNWEGVIVGFRDGKSFPRDEPLIIRFKGGIECYASGDDVRPKRNGLRRFMALIESWAL